MGLLFLRVRTWWQTADRTQRVVTLFGLGLLGAMLVATFVVASRPQMMLLYPGLVPEEQGAVMSELTSRGVPFTQDRGGNVYVPASRVPEIRATLAASGKAPSGSGRGADPLANIGMMNTPSVERQRLIAATEGELERSIRTLPDVKSARVHLTLGDDSPFASVRKPAAASVVIVPSAAGAVTARTGEAIARLLTGGVAGLETRNVTVIADGEVIWDGQDAGGGGPDRRLSAQVAEARRREVAWQRDLDRAFGAGSTLLKVELELDFDDKTVTKTERTPSETPISSEKNTESLGSAGSGLAGGIAGLAANTPGAVPPSPSGGSENYTGKREAVRYEVNETVSTAKVAPGDVRRMAVSVLVDSERIKDPAPVREFVRGLVASYQGPSYTLNVTSHAFDHAAEEAAKKEATAIASQERTQQIFSLIPMLALVGVGFMVVRALGKSLRPGAPLEMVALPAGTPAQVGGGGGMSAPVAAVGREVAAQQIATEMRARSEPAPQEEIDAIPEQLNVPAEQIKKMAQERPEAVAVLVKSWLLEDRN